MPAPHTASKDDLADAAGPLAAIDLGSNSFRLEIAQLPGGRYRRIDYLKETVRLGGGLDAHGHLSEEAMQRGLECLGRFAERLADHPSSRVRAVATQTLREARNRDLFLARAGQVLGLPIEVISGREEARLIYAGVARLQPSAVRRLVIDIGGRSTEMIIGRGTTPLRAESFQVGSVSLSMKYFADGRFTQSAFRAAQIAAGAELEEALEPFGRRHWREALGASGTVGAVSQVLAASGAADGRITPSGLRALIERCIEVGQVDKLDLPGLREDRRAIVGGGLAILYTLALQFGIETLLPARGALRQGVIFDLEERRLADLPADRGHDIREASVGELQSRFAVDAAQAARVGRIAGGLLLAALPGAAAETLREMRWACALHEVGMMVSHHDHHRHSAYVIGHVDAAGFSQSQLRRVGELVLGQRGGLRKLEDRLGDETFAWQVLCLRLAVILCHARGGTDAEGALLTREGRAARLDFPPVWFDAHPRTLHLLREEQVAWARTGVLALELGGALD
jgi:exopolyphosphatase/guanosine-5'-triphosphate,3'-diphosphate pyrophosphatase